MPQQESFTDLMFPTSGLDLSDGFYAQRPGSSRQGQNVRAFEPSTGRMRGGSRSGLSRYLTQLPNGSQKVQHLAAVVTASGDALLANFQFPSLDLVDPSTPGLPADWPPGTPVQPSRIPPGQKVPTGGTGVQPNKRHAFQVVVQPIVFVQAKDNASGTTTSCSITFASSVASGDLLLVAVLVNRLISNPALPSVSDGLGTSYTQLGTLTQGTSVRTRLTLYYGIASSAGSCVVSVTQAGTNLLSLAATGWAYRNTQTSPLDGTATWSSAGTAISLGPVTVSQSGTLVAGVTASINTGTVGAGETARFDGGQLVLVEKLLASAATSLTWTSPSSTTLAIGGSFKPQIG